MSADFTSKQITVMGLGRFGGGAGVTRWLAAQGALVHVTDMQPEESLRDSVAEIADLIAQQLVTLRLGAHETADFTQCDLVVANPAVPKPWENRYINAAIDAGVPITTEIRLLTERINCRRVIGITGSAGKSTTAAMIHHVLCKLGCRSHLGGNIGGSLLNHLNEIHSDDWIVLELSSAMLHWLGETAASAQSKIQSPNSTIKGWSPHVAVVTNISPNHIDWHGSFEHYKQSKLNIFKYQHDGDHQLTSDDLPACTAPVRLKVPGKHNQTNAQLALTAVGLALGEPNIGDRGTLLADFPGLPHRLQLVAEHDGMRFFNDSKSTTPEATVLAVSAFDDSSKIHLIAGGYDKGSDLTPITRLASHIAGLYTLGTTGPSLAANAGGFARDCNTLNAAVTLARSRMKRGDILLLSPGCASWDQFTNYEERGDAFVRMATESL